MEDAKSTTSRADLERLGKLWVERVKAADTRESAWRKAATEAEAIYLADEEADVDMAEFNILHSNVETIVSSVYNSTPSPDIRSSVDHGEGEEAEAADKAYRQAATLLERAVSKQIDNNALDAEVEAAAQDVLVAGRGVVRIRFNYDEEENEGVSYRSEERVEYEAVSWRDFVHGPAKRWSKVPWIAFRQTISGVDRDNLEDSEIREAYAGDEDQNASADAEEEEVDVWEIWDRDNRRVIFVQEDNAKIITQRDDPLRLRGFFPIPEPVAPIKPVGKLTPTCPYAIYRRQAEELDRITGRIDAIISGLKVRGFVVGAAGDIAKLADADDNELVPIANTENLAAAGSLDRLVLWWPVEQAIAVLRELYVQRNEVKATIYEITGISDIIRGQGAASETATAQQIKTQWGGLRIKKMQRLIERQVRDLMQMSVEIISNLFSPEAIKASTGVQQIDDLQLSLIRSPMLFFAINVESDSTVRADTTQKRGEMSEFMASSAQFFQTMAPIVAQAPKTAGAIVDIYASFARGFSLGKQAEDAIDQLVSLARQASQQDRPDPGAEAAKVEREKMANEQDAAKQEMALKERELGLKEREIALRAQEIDVKKDEAASRLSLARTSEARETAHQYRQAQTDQRDLQLRTVDQLKGIRDAEANKAPEADPVDVAGALRELGGELADAAAKVSSADGQDARASELLAAVVQSFGGAADRIEAAVKAPKTMTFADGETVTVEAGE